MAYRDMKDSDLEKQFQKAWNKTHAPVIDMKKPNPWHDSTFSAKFAAAIFVSFILPIAILFFGLLALVIFDALT